MTLPVSAPLWAAWALCALAVWVTVIVVASWAIDVATWVLESDFGTWAGRMWDD